VRLADHLRELADRRGFKVLHEYVDDSFWAFSHEQRCGSPSGLLPSGPYSIIYRLFDRVDMRPRGVSKVIRSQQRD